MEILAQIAAPESVSYWPFGILAIGIVFVVVMIAVLRVHAFFSLMLAAALVGFLSGKLPGDSEKSSLINALDLPMLEFGNTAGKIAWVIALASIIGVCLLESGAADKIVRQIMRVIGEHRAAWALLISGFFLGIPVFFDTVFFLMVPLAMALGLRLGKNYLLFVMAICAGGAVTHHMVPPTPGPLFMVEALGLNLGSAIIAGILIGLPPSIAAVLIARKLDLKLNLPVRESSGISMADLKAIVSKKDSELPPFFLSILPVALPVFLIATASFFDAFMEPDLRNFDLRLTSANDESKIPDYGVKSVSVSKQVGEDTLQYKIFDTAGTKILDKSETEFTDKSTEIEEFKGELTDLWNQQGFTDAEKAPIIDAFASITGHIQMREGAAYRWMEFIGNKYFAMFLGTLIAVWLLARQKKMTIKSLEAVMGPPLSTAGTIILITAAGGAFGTMIKHAGVGDAIDALSSKIGLSYILLAWLVASVMKIAQGSGTVAMITSAGIMAAVIGDGTGLPYHPMYIYLAIGFGSMVISWMNDSGFWVVCKLSGFTEKETLKSWTVVLGSAGVIGLIEVLIVSSILPMPIGN